MTTNNKPRRMARPLLETASSNTAIVGSSSDASIAAPQTRPTKQAMVLGLLQKEGGALLSDIVDATGWLPHTSRAALTGLRKIGHAIVRCKVDGETCYAIAPAAHQ